MSTIKNFIYCDIQLPLKYIHTGQTEMLCSHLGNAYSILFWITADVQYLFHDQIDCVGYPHFDFNLDDGSLQCMINNRFGHNCTFRIPKYN